MLNKQSCTDIILNILIVWFGLEDGQRVKYLWFVLSDYLVKLVDMDLS